MIGDDARQVHRVAVDDHFAQALITMLAFNVHEFSNGD
jgi:hypothetical protein